MNKADIKEYFLVKDEIEDRVCDIASLIDIDYIDYRDRGTIIDLTEGDGAVYVSIEHQATCGCCGPDYVDVNFPTELLYGEDWKDKALAFRKEMEEKRDKRIKEEEKKKEEAKKKSIVAWKKREEEKDKADYIRLKGKFESD